MRILFAFFLLIPLTIFSQDLTGVWKGFMEVRGVDIPFEILINGTAENLSGYSMTTLIIDDIENVGIKEAEIRKKKDKYLFEDGELVFNNFSTPGKRIILTASLHLDSSARKPELNGNYRTRSLDMRDKTSYTGRIFLQKTEKLQGSSLLAKLQLMKLASEDGELLAFGKASERNETVAEQNENTEINKEENTSRKSKLINKDNQPSGKRINPDNSQANQLETSRMEQSNASSRSNNAITQKKQADMTLAAKDKPATKSKPPAAEMAIRIPRLIHEFSFSSDSLDLKFYDNGTVDGDTITVLLDDQHIISKEQLRTQAIERTIRIPEDKDSLSLIMYAENLGLYPPNTGILVIRDGKSRIEIRFMGDLDYNPVIKLHRKK